MTTQNSETKMKINAELNAELQSEINAELIPSF